ncbi:MAG TPA: hypothetical protein VK152_04155 [Paludibacter sp.]|nr:hypothetical protein [Paludibacter sp.]
MNRKFIATLLQKDIRELEMITDGFMEMSEYPKAIIHLAQQKAENIQAYIQQLSEYGMDGSAIPEVHAMNKEDMKISREFHEHPVAAGEPVLTPETEDVKPEPTSELRAEEVEEFATTTKSMESREEPAKSIAVSGSGETPTKDLGITGIETITETATVEENQKTSWTEKASNHSQSRYELLSKPDNTLGATLANKKIDDIRQALNIGDRFRYQRELFRGNGEDMNKTLSYLNQLATYNEAESFLQSKYTWDKGNETVDDFYQLLRRKFL